MNGNASSAKSYRRGVRLGIYFKRVRDLLTKWDRRCVETAKTHQMPAWLGHVPVYAAIAIGIGILAFSLISSFVLIIGVWVLWLVLNQKNCSRIYKNENHEYESQQRDGPDGFGWYDSPDYLTGVRIDSNNDDE